MDIIDVIDGVHEGTRRLCEPFMAFAGWVFAIEIMIAEADDSRGNLAEAIEPSNEALEIVARVYAVERVDDIARYKDVVRILGFGLLDDGVKDIGGDFWSEMNVGNEEKFEAIFAFWLIKLVASMIEAFH